MIPRFGCLLLLVVVSLTTLCQGSTIVFTATPTNITAGLTTSLTVRCALQNGGSSTNTVSRVSTITIRKAEGSSRREVAKIVSGQAAVPGAWAAGASVTGALSNTEGHLQATWSDPGAAQAGGYNCEIVALEADGTNIKLKSNVQVESTTQSVADLTRLISQSKDEIATLKKDFSDDIATLKKTFSNDIATIKTAYSNDIETLKNSFSNLKASVSSNLARHNEQGTVLFEMSKTWGADFQYRESVRTVQFSVPYDKLPLVILSAVRVDTEHTRNTIYKIEVRDLTTTGFKVVCSSYWDAIIWRINAQWTSSIY